MGQRFAVPNTCGVPMQKRANIVLSAVLLAAAITWWIKRVWIVHTTQARKVMRAVVRHHAPQIGCNFAARCLTREAEQW